MNMEHTWTLCLGLGPIPQIPHLLGIWKYSEAFFAMARIKPWTLYISGSSMKDTGTQAVNNLFFSDFQMPLGH